MSEDCPFGEDLQSYWDKRHYLFSRFDEGIRIDREGLFSVKPEHSALEVGDQLAGERVLDGFCGVGGSAIGLARAGKRVVTVDIDAGRLEMARHNAQLYGVADCIEFVRGDFFDVLAGGGWDAVYLDPPWGGLKYHARPRFPLSGFQPDATRLLTEVFHHTEQVAFAAPMSLDLAELARLRPEFRVSVCYHDDEPIFLTLFFGD